VCASCNYWPGSQAQAVVCGRLLCDCSSEHWQRGELPALGPRSVKALALVVTVLPLSATACASLKVADGRRASGLPHWSRSLAALRLCQMRPAQGPGASTRPLEPWRGPGSGPHVAGRVTPTRVGLRAGYSVAAAGGLAECQVPDCGPRGAPRRPPGRASVRLPPGRGHLAFKLTRTRKTSGRLRVRGPAALRVTVRQACRAPAHLSRCQCQ
jgi:hypothetical protein